MRSFVNQLFIFVLIFIGIIIIGLLMPATPRAKQSLIFSSLQKDSLLEYVKSPRIIFVGGSNLSFGLNSQMVKDSLELNPINSGISGAIGLNYMLNNTLEYIQPNDIVVVVPEYQQFYEDVAFGGDGGEELVRIIFDANTSKICLLSPREFFNVLKMMPKYAFSKLSPQEYLNPTVERIYSVQAFNEYGDANAHFGLKKESFPPKEKLEAADFDYAIVKKLIQFKTAIEQKKALLFVSFPAYQDSSYLKSTDQIERIQALYQTNHFNILGTPDRYVMPDSMLFNTPYHLTRSGVDYRTKMFIQDFKKQFPIRTGSY